MVEPSGPAQPTSVSPWRKVALAVFAGFLALLLSEIILQLTEQPSVSIRFQQDVGELDQLGMKTLAEIVENDNELFWRLTPNTSLPKKEGPFFGVIANGQGFREDHDIPLKKPTGDLRILFLGDSCTFGYGLEHSEGYVDIAEQLLKQRLERRSVECINAGVPGYTLFQGWQLWKNHARQLNPDLVVVCFGGNDMSSWDDKTDLQHYEHLKRQQPPGILQASSLSRRLWKMFNKPEPTRAIAEPRVTPRDFQQLLGKLQQSITATDASMLILVWPFLPQVAKSRDQRTKWQQEMVRFSGQPDTKVLDLVPEFHKLADQHGAEALYLDQGHATALGNQHIGELVANLLEQQFANSTNQQP